MENGSEYRTLLKAFGIRFDVLVYGNVSPGARHGVGRRGDPGQLLGPAGADQLSHLPSPPLTMKGWGLPWLCGHVRVSGWEAKFSLRVHPCCWPSAYPPPSLRTQAGKFNIIPTIISSVAAFTSVGVVSSAPGIRPDSRGGAQAGKGRGGAQASPDWPGGKARPLA